MIMHVAYDHQCNAVNKKKHQQATNIMMSRRRTIGLVVVLTVISTAWLYKLLGNDWEGIWGWNGDKYVPNQITTNVPLRYATTSAPLVSAPPAVDFSWLGSFSDSPWENIKSPNEFVNKCCDLGKETWWPADSWMLRAPAFLVIGAKKCGTTSLFTYLSQHPQIQKPRSKELLYFIPKRFPNWEDKDRFGSKVLVEPSRADMFERDYPAAVIQKNEMLMSFEATPDYLLYSTYSAQAILCTMPWVKIVITLRDPIDRLFSHYNFVSQPHMVKLGKVPPMKVSFHEWVQQEIDYLKTFGVIPQSKNDTKTFFKSPDEARAWREYQKAKGPSVGDRFLARSLYAIQVEEWYQALRVIGRDPREQVLIVREEDMKKDAAAVSNRIFDWLGLPRFAVNGSKSSMVTLYTSELKEETRRMLEDLFEPYNHRLYDFLGGEWKGVWDRTSSKSRGK
jgi:hypothetical protein